MGASNRWSFQGLSRPVTGITLTLLMKRGSVLMNAVMATAVLDLISQVKILFSLNNTPWVYEITTK